MVFETVPALVGVGFRVDGVEGFSSALDVVGVAGVDGALVTDPVNLKGMLAKYGFAELHFELAGVPDGLGPADAKTVLELFGASGVDRSESDDVAMRILFLEDLGKEMD